MSIAEDRPRSCGYNVCAVFVVSYGEFWVFWGSGLVLLREFWVVETGNCAFFCTKHVVNLW